MSGRRTGSRCRSPRPARRTGPRHIQGFKERLSWHGVTPESNPSGGNKLRGLYNITLKSLAAGIQKAGSTDTDKVIEAFRGLKLQTPAGPMEYRAIDHQGTMGAWVGKTTIKGGKPTMTDFKYVDGAAIQPSDAEVKKMRPQEH